MYSASVVEIETECCLVDRYEIRQDPKRNPYPDQERRVSQQFLCDASENPTRDKVLGVRVYDKPRERVPER